MPEQQLIDYIKGSLEKGKTKESIKESLLSVGWKFSDIEDAFNSLVLSGQLNQNVASGIISSQAYPEKNSEKSKKIIIIAIVALIAIVGGFYLYIQAHTPKVDLSGMTESADESSTDSNFESKSTAGIYQKFDDKDYVYSIEYPREWAKMQIPIGNSSTPDPYKLLNMKMFYPSPAAGSVSEKIEEIKNATNAVIVVVMDRTFTFGEVKDKVGEFAESPDIENLGVKEVTINGLKGFEVMVRNKTKNLESKEVIITFGGKSYDLACAGTLDFYDKYCDSIINSFKIKKSTNSAQGTETLEPITQDEILGWQTFSKSNLQLRLPPDYSRTGFRDSGSSLVAGYKNGEGDQVVINYSAMPVSDVESEILSLRNFVRESQSQDYVGKLREVVVSDIRLQVSLMAPLDSKFVSASEIMKGNCDLFPVVFETKEGKIHKQAEIFFSNNSAHWATIIMIYNKNQGEEETQKVIRSMECQ